MPTQYSVYECDEIYLKDSKTYFFQVLMISNNTVYIFFKNLCELCFL